MFQKASLCLSVSSLISTAVHVIDFNVLLETRADTVVNVKKLFSAFLSQ